MKFSNASSILKWFYDNFNSDLIYLVRHPIPTALSQMKWDLEPRTDDLFQDPQLKSDFLTVSQRRELQKIAQYGSRVEKHVVDWCIENMKPLSALDSVPVKLLLYEKMVLHPQDFIDDMVISFSLKDKDALKAQIQRPSRTRSREFKKKRNLYTPLNHLKSWQSEASDVQKKKIQNLLDIFEIDLYSAYDYLPKIL
jgi:hypothetical protein